MGQKNSLCTEVLSTPDGAEIHYCVIGTGTPLVMLHGNRQSHRVFRQQIAFFRNHYRLILIDSRGHGLSSLGRLGLSTQIMAQDTLHLLDHLHIDKAIILGYSDGGNTALQLALTAPARLSAIIMIGANLDPHGLKPLIYFFSLCQFHLLSTLKRLHFPVRRLQQTSALMALYPQIQLEDLEKLRLPVLIIAGQFDIVRKKHTLAIADAVPHARLKIVRHAGHLGLFVYAVQYDTMIQNFLDEIRDRHR